MSVDWGDPELSTTVQVLQVDAHDRDSVLGTLDFTAVTISYGYYTDSRVSAKVTTLEADRLIDGAWLRVVLEVDGQEWQQELFTGYVSGVDESRGPGGMVETSLELSSALMALDSDALPNLFCVGERATARQAIASIMDRAGMPWRFEAGAGDYRFTSTRLYDPGESLLSVLFDVAGTADMRIDVDGHGTVVFAGYTRPASVSPAVALDSDGPRSVVLASSVGRSSDQYAAANRSIVVWKDDDDSFITGYADVPSSSSGSYARRGVRVAEVHELQDMPEPRSVAHAQQLAQRYLQDDASWGTEYQASVMWSGDVRCGDVVSFAPPGGAPVKVLVSAVDSDPLGMRMDLTLKEVGNGD